MDRVCAFFGHRELEGNISAALESAIRKAIGEQGINVFWCGGYGAFDSSAAHAVKQLEFPQIKLLRILAYLPKEKESIPAVYDGSIYPEGLETVPRRFAISRRNQWMAQNCDMAITYVNRDFGGAYNAWKQAKRAGKQVINLGTLE
jgi:hypothetical protein